MSPQLTVFDDDAIPGSDDVHALALSRVHEEARALAASVPSGVHFGTSSWSFPGWRGILLVV